MHSFTYRGLNSRDYCKMFVSGGGTFNAPERDIESISVPGRNGDLTIDHGRFNNVVVEYPAWIAEDFKVNMAKARAWLCGIRGYARLEDDYHPDEFRMARYLDGIDVTTLPFHQAGTMTLKFDCMPQRFLKSGEEPIVLNKNNWTRSGTTATKYITNPTAFNAKPLIVITDTVNITNCTILCSNGKENTTLVYTNQNGIKNLTLDSELLNAYTSSTSVNNYVTGDFPILFGSESYNDGRNNIYFSVTGLSNNAVITITPRWWTI